MKRVLLFTALAGLFIFSSAFAYEFTWPGYDFGIDNPFDRNNNYSPISYPCNIDTFPSPGPYGEGGEKFDLEGLHYDIEGNQVHIAIVNSFGFSQTSSYWKDSYGNPQAYELGDIFFGFDGSNMQYAISLDNMAVYAVNEVDGWLGIQDIPGSYYNYPTIRNAVGAWKLNLQNTGDALASVVSEEHIYDDLENEFGGPLSPGTAETHILEFSFDLTNIAGFSSASSVGFHNTLGCGNDLIEKCFSAVPEPTTWILLGMGALGLGSFARRKRER